MLRHVILTATYESNQAIPSKTFTQAIKETIDREPDAQAAAAVTYTSHFPINPMNVAIKDVWMNMSTVERRDLEKWYPDLTKTIFLLLTGLEGDRTDGTQKNDLQRRITARVYAVPPATEKETDSETQ